MYIINDPCKQLQSSLLKQQLKSSNMQGNTNSTFNARKQALEGSAGLATLS
jgi:hypothetical protein